MAGEPMTVERLAEIEARAAAATPGPWEALLPAGKTAADGVLWLMSISEIGSAHSLCVDDAFAWDDAEFLAASRADIPDLIAEVRRLRDTLTVLTGAID